MRETLEALAGLLCVFSTFGTGLSMIGFLCWRSHLRPAGFGFWRTLLTTGAASVWVYAAGFLIYSGLGMNAALALGIGLISVFPWIKAGLKLSKASAVKAWIVFSLAQCAAILCGTRLFIGGLGDLFLIL